MPTQQLSATATATGRLHFPRFALKSIAPEPVSAPVWSVRHWTDASLGNHRARLRLPGQRAEGWHRAVWAVVEWRLPGIEVEARQLQLRELATDRLVTNLRVASIGSHAATIVFEPLPQAEGGGEGAGVSEGDDYLLYYLPNRAGACETGPSKGCATPYRRSSPAQQDVECAGNHGAGVGGPACCGQRGTVGRHEHICPAAAPECRGYVMGSSWGTCAAALGGGGGGGGAGADTAWATRIDTLLARGSSWRDGLPQAAVLGFEARSERDSFWPMEVAASAAELARVRAWGRPLLVQPEGPKPNPSPSPSPNPSPNPNLNPNPNPNPNPSPSPSPNPNSYPSPNPNQVWPEDRRYPIRMSHTLPLRWVSAGAAPPNASVLKAQARRGEWFAFQLGVHAALAPLRISALGGGMMGDGAAATTTTGLRGVRHGGYIGPERLRVVNQPSGSAAASHGIEVAQGEVLALWVGVDVPPDAAADVYRGVVVLRDLSAPGVVAAAAEAVAVELEVGDEAPIEQHGDSELWRHSRLRWLDSAVGEASSPVEAPIKKEASTPVEAPNKKPTGGGVIRGRPVGAITKPVEALAAAAAVSMGGWDEPVRWDGSTAGGPTVTASGARQMRLTPLGLPSSLSVGGRELLSAPAELRLVMAAGGGAGGVNGAASGLLHLEAVEEGTAALRLGATAGGGVRWSATAGGRGGGGGGGSGGCAALRVTVSGELETDGLALMSAELHMPHDHHHGGGGGGGGGAAGAGGCALDDVQLRLPLRAAAVRSLVSPPSTGQVPRLLYNLLTMAILTTLGAAAQRLRRERRPPTTRGALAVDYTLPTMKAHFTMAPPIMVLPTKAV